MHLLGANGTGQHFFRVDPNVKGHTMYFLINGPPPKLVDVTTFAGAYATSCRWKLRSPTILENRRLGLVESVQEK